MSRGGPFGLSHNTKIIMKDNPKNLLQMKLASGSDSLIAKRKKM